MYIQSTYAALAASCLLLPWASAQGMYTKNSPVLQVDGRNYDKLIAKSNQASIIEFYAPWCGHCKNLKPAYEKAAKSLKDLANVAAVNCDDENNKPFCGNMGIQGFPTLKIVKPGKKTGKPVVEDYHGGRTAKDLVDAVKQAIPNHVKKVSDKGLDNWLAESNSTAKAILFSEKGTTSALIKVLASEFIETMPFAQMRNKDTTAVKVFGIESYPTLIVLPGGTEPRQVYTGDMAKQPMLAFLSEFGIPSSSPSAKKDTKQKPLKKKENPAASSADSSAFSAASASHASSEASSSAASAGSETIVDDGNPTESPDPIATPEEAPTPAAIPVPPPLPFLATEAELRAECLYRSSTPCVLLILPPSTPSTEETTEKTTNAISTLSLAAQNQRRGAFRFFVIPSSSDEPATADSKANDLIRSTLSLPFNSETPDLLVLNYKRGWLKRFPPTSDLSERNIENWVDGVRMGDGKKEKIEGWKREEEEETAPPSEEPIVPDSGDKPPPSHAEQAPDPVPEQGVEDEEVPVQSPASTSNEEEDPPEPQPEAEAEAEPDTRAEAEAEAEAEETPIVEKIVHGEL
ncbi:hypothetical protein MMC09_000059 [Bachmanniomyces sp. S44760]|nr:hypothetical protein [Bachmanniomyces sp. S44760]